MTNPQSLCPSDPVWEASRPDRGPVKWYVEYDLPKQRGDSVTMSESLICYTETDRATALSKAARDRGQRVRVLTYEEKNGRPAPVVRS